MNMIENEERRVRRKISVSMRIVLVALVSVSGALTLRAAAAIDWVKTTPAEAVKDTPKGELHNPYKDTQADIVAQGETLFRSYACSGCHGGNGGGGMCPPTTNDIWVYGGDDDTLFRLVTLGSVDLQKAGYERIGHENVVGPMPPMGSVVKNADDLWKMITFIRAHYDGDPSYKYGAPASEVGTPH